jgi:hypothetical protein
MHPPTCPEPVEGLINAFLSQPNRPILIVCVEIVLVQANYIQFRAGPCLWGEEEEGPDLVARLLGVDPGEGKKILIKRRNACNFCSGDQQVNVVCTFVGDH